MEERLRRQGVSVDKILHVISDGDSGDGEMVLFLCDGKPFEAHFYAEGRFDLRCGWTED
jgi:hypothetical protein